MNSQNGKDGDPNLGTRSVLEESALGNKWIGCIHGFLARLCVTGLSFCILLFALGLFLTKPETNYFLSHAVVDSTAAVRQDYLHLALLAAHADRLAA